MSSSEKRTVVPESVYSTSASAGHVLELGPGATVGVMPHSKRTAKRYDVFLDGERIGSVQSSERRGEVRIPGMRNVVRVKGWPTAWRFYDAGGHTTRLGRTFTTRAEAIHELVDHVTRLQA
ncbi:hypothetical protein [Curtobacterium sp. MCBD17_040]|uniref:hypothetical protein n=1 Tax=Curtobacterium sp. MCBD17_040 TaxID=2175674 RepID=UPI000DB0EB16|nr:hypothetical protein [Curtobacterium sp. MCBD17_040]WIB65885.1 hypothetical protein DEI94_17370 [Curtobacterium sp. MCBD17_040]